MCVIKYLFLLALSVVTCAFENVLVLMGTIGAYGVLRLRHFVISHSNFIISPFVLADSLKIIGTSLLLFIIASYVPILITSPVVLLICFELVVDYSVTYVGVFSLCPLPD